MRQKLLFLKIMAVGVLLLMGMSAKATTYYIKTNGSTAWANVTGGTVKELAAGNVITAFSTINAAADGTSTYYFAPGTYNINFPFALTTGQIYGGFTGNESSTSDLTTRVTSDLDGNGIVEPWEFSSVVTFTTTLANGNYSGTGAGTRLLTITGTGGEANGITLYDYCYKTTGGHGVIVLGEAISTPTDGLNAANAGKLTQCIVRQLKNGGAATTNGVIMITNTSSVIDKCLIEDCRVLNGSGTVYINKYGGVISNSVIRNNIVSASGGAIWFGSTATGIVTDAIVKNCAVYNNTATNGGAIRSEAFSETLKGIQIVNCTVVNNSTTAASPAGSIELIKTGLIANTISLSDTRNEVRPNTPTNYVINTVYGSATGASTLYPSTSNNTSGIADLTFSAVYFKTPTTFQGAVGNSTSDVAGWTLAKQNEIKASNYYITSNSSNAYTTYSTTYVTLPSSFLSAGGTGSSISITATVPTIDINGDTRNTIGAYNYDGTAPTVTITSSASSPTATSPIPVTFTFSENITGFVVGDVTIGNGTLSAITAVSGKVFTATITPAANGPVTVDIAATKVKDGAGNDNTAATQFSITYGAVSTAPVGVTTTAVTGIGSASATSGISSTSDGGSPITASGVVWSTSSNPEINLLTKTTNGSGSITGLSNNTTYFVRAYATNSIGTSYGSELSFTTKWAITASAGTNGTVSGGGDFANNATVTLTASATIGRFISWTENGVIVSINRNYSFNATSNRTLVANFGNVESIYYVRPAGSSAWGNIGASSNQIITATDATNNFNLAFLANNLPDGTATYYMAAGNYTLINIVLNQGTQLTTGKIYGGFTGNESSIDLNTRATSDLDGNGIVEPWEMTNATVISGNTGLKYADSGSGTSGERLIRIDNGGEVNGVTLTDYNYGSYGGAISVGTPATTPSDDVDGKKGFLKRCIVRKIKSAIGVIMLTNSRSEVDQCLIEDNYGTLSYGAIYFNRFGGTVSNSIIRNNKATTYGGAIYAGNSAASTDLKAIVKNCAIYNNTALTNGGAIRCDANSASLGGIEIVNSTIVNNTTSGAGVASVELINNGLLVNSIVVNDTKDEIRAHSASHYVDGVAYGTATGLTLYPATSMATSKTYTDFNFVSPTTVGGYVGIPGDAGFNQTNYDAVHAANFSINNTSSVAVATTAVTSISDYNVSGSGALIHTYSSVPTTDITGLTRTGAKTLGAYQATHSVALGETQTISQPTTLASLTVAAGGKLSITNGVAVNIGSLTLESDANGTATMIDSYNTPTVTATVKQYVTAGRNWYVSAPVSNALYSQVTGGDSVVAFNEALKKWEKVTADNLIAGKGYIRAAIASSGSTGTVDFNGLANSGNISVTVTRTESGSSRGFNLVGNPYPSYLNWTSFVADPANVNTGTSFWYRTKNTNGAYVFVTHNGTSGEVIGGTTANTIITNLIPPMQAFWVRVDANSLTTPTTYSTSITFKNDMRDHLDDNGNKLKAPALTERKRLRLQVSNGVNSDESLIYFDAKANDAYDNFDSPKMFNNAASVPEIFTQVGAEKLVMNGLNEVKYDTEIPLGFITGAVNNFTLKATELKNFDAETKIILKDKLNPGNEFDLSQGESYNFSAGITSASTNRFSLIFRTSGSTTGIENAVKQNTHVFVNTANQIVIAAAEKCNYAIYNAMGQLIESGIINSKLITQNSKLTTGVYVVKVNNQSTRVIIK